MKHTTCILVLYVVLYISSCDARKIDYYSSISAVTELVAAESLLIDSLEKCITQKKESVKVIGRYISNSSKLSDVSSDLSDNPLNAFQMIHRVLNDFPELNRLILDTTHIEEYQKFVTDLELDILPTTGDISGASLGLARLQRTYQLPTEDIADGILMDYYTSPPMSADECFEVGRHLNAAGEYKYALEWLTEARLRMRTDTDHGFSDARVLEYLASTYYNLTNWKMSLKMYQELLELEPTNVIGLEHIKSAEKMLHESRRLSYVRPDKHVAATSPQANIWELHEKVCRGELKPTPQQQRELRCRYSSRNVPFCLLARFKMEELSLDPYVAYFHEIITDAEITQILDASEDYIMRSKVVGNALHISEHRTSQNTWLNLKEHNFLQNIVQRLTDITGLSTESAEHLQVANYGIGGHYGPHHDFFEDDGIEIQHMGNRILTAMFYINDVEMGGGTGFPHLRLLVPPIKRSLVMWYNLHESLEKDYRSLHAGCPVLKGSKWICNEWFHSAHQEFRRPCGLHPNGNMSIAYKTTL